ncbi:MAG: hypothetical protein HY683_07320 [Chloroflexi bacterium]|nr:hypothetical protein [Chloroflexota bacterium]
MTQEVSNPWPRSRLPGIHRCRQAEGKTVSIPFPGRPLCSLEWALEAELHAPQRDESEVFSQLQRLRLQVQVDAFAGLGELRPDRALPPETQAEVARTRTQLGQVERQAAAAVQDLRQAGTEGSASSGLKNKLAGLVEQREMLLEKLKAFGQATKEARGYLLSPG